MCRSQLVVAVGVVALALGVIPARGVAQAVATQQAQSLTKKELKVLIANARTPEDHRRIAAYYRAEEGQLRAKQREHEAELAEYLKNPSSHPVPKWPTMDQHCRQLIFYYDKAAQKAFAMADLHEKMAEEAGQK